MKTNVALSSYTTFGIGGPAKYFIEAQSNSELIAALKFAKEKDLWHFILGGGSNVLIADAGLDAVVIKIGLKGEVQSSILADNIILKVPAGIVWDDFVSWCVQNGYSGIEFLSGIPGLVGAAPIQNIGAYGQEVKDTITKVGALDTRTLQTRVFNNQECNFEYRTSLFKKNPSTYVVLWVEFKLKQNGSPRSVYKEILDRLDSGAGLQDARQLVLSIRREKSMIVDKRDKNSQSAGSFFINPKITKARFNKLKRAYPEIPYYSVEDSTFPYKIPAAWLIEASGFNKGYRHKGAGISSKHALSIVNAHNARAEDVLELATMIEDKVSQAFGIKLEREARYIC